MKRQFVITLEGIKIKVIAKSSHNQYIGLRDMQKVGSYQFFEVQTGKSRGSATRYYQKCQEIMLLADTEDEIRLAVSALAWLEENDMMAWEAMVWNTSDIGDPEDFKNSSSEQESQQEQSEEQEDSQSDSNNNYEEDDSQSIDKAGQIDVRKKQSKRQKLTKKKEIKIKKKQNNPYKYTDKLRSRHRP